MWQSLCPSFGCFVQLLAYSNFPHPNPLPEGKGTIGLYPQLLLLLPPGEGRGEGASITSSAFALVSLNHKCHSKNWLFVFIPRHPWCLRIIRDSLTSPRHPPISAILIPTIIRFFFVLSCLLHAFVVQSPPSASPAGGKNKPPHKSFSLTSHLTFSLQPV